MHQYFNMSDTSTGILRDNYDFSLVEEGKKYVKEIPSDDFHRVFHDTPAYEFWREFCVLLEKNYVGDGSCQTFLNTLRLSPVSTIERVIFNICDVFGSEFKKESLSMQDYWSKIGNQPRWLVDELCGYGTPNYSILRFTLIGMREKTLIFEKERTSFLYDLNGKPRRTTKKISHGVFSDTYFIQIGKVFGSISIARTDRILVTNGIKDYVETFEFNYRDTKHGEDKVALLVKDLERLGETAYYLPQIGTFLTTK